MMRKPKTWERQIPNRKLAPPPSIETILKESISKLSFEEIYSLSGDIDPENKNKNVTLYYGTWYIHNSIPMSIDIYRFLPESFRDYILVLDEDYDSCVYYYYADSTVAGLWALKKKIDKIIATSEVLELENVV